ncbi:hypothetical protein DSECCO2_548900 [anaerobic digester metagenome]
MGSEVDGGIGIGKFGKLKADGQHRQNLAFVMAFVQKYTAGFIGDSGCQLIDTGPFEADRAAAVCERSVHIGRPVLKSVGVVHQPFDGEAVQISGFGFDRNIRIGVNILRQAVADGRHRIHLEALLVAVGSATVVGEFRFQNIAALGMKLQLTAAVAQRTLHRIGEGYFFSVTEQRPICGMAADFPEHCLHHHGAVGVEDFRQIEARRTYRVDGNMGGIGKHSAGIVGDRGGQRIHTFFLESDATVSRISFDPCVGFGRLAVPGQGVGHCEAVRFFCFCLERHGFIRMRNGWECQLDLRYRVDRDAILCGDNLAQLIRNRGGQLVYALFLEQHRAAGGIQRSGESRFDIDGSAILFERPYHRIGTEVFGHQLHRHGFVGMGGFGQSERRRHNRVDADGLLMGHRDAPAVFGRGNQGDAAGLHKFHFTAVVVKGTVCQL